MLKLKLQCFSHLMWTDNSLEKSLMPEKIEGRMRRGCQRMRWLESITDAMNTDLGKFREMARDREAWHAAVHGVTKSRTLGDWTTTTSPTSLEQYFRVIWNAASLPIVLIFVPKWKLTHNSQVAVYFFLWEAHDSVPANTGDVCSSPGLGRYPGEGKGNPLQYYCLANSMDRGAWRATVHGVAKSRIWLGDLTTTQVVHFF